MKLLGLDFQKALTTFNGEKRLTTNSDTIIGITLGFIASQQRNGFSAELEIWLKQIQCLGYQLDLPENWFVTDIVENLHQHSAQFYVLSKDGKLTREEFQKSELLTIIMKYQELSKRSFYR